MAQLIEDCYKPHRRHSAFDYLSPLPAIALPLLLAAFAGCASFPPHHPAKPPALAAIIPPPKFFLAKTAPPPALGSTTVTRQVAEIIALQSRATPEKIADARWTYEFSVFTFSIALDPSFTAKRYPQTAKFFMERLMPETALRKARIEAGADTMMELAAEAF